VGFKDVCRSHIKLLTRKLIALEENSNFFFKLRKKQKRSLFDFVGSFQHFLFGVMDNEDREKIQDNLQTILKNQYNLESLQKKHISVLDSTLNVLKETTADINKQFEEMDKQINNFLKDQSTFNYRILLNNVLMQLSMALDRCENIQNNIIDLLIDIHHGRINPQLVSPSQLNREIYKIESFVKYD